jgi:peptidoglycan/xylan/chitin deacetylase (PgdA/CDA1 family)
MTHQRTTQTALCTIFGYHEIAPLRPGIRRSLIVSPATFASHLAYLRLTGGHSVRLEDVELALAGKTFLPPRAFAITFDDGYLGINRYALSILRRFGCSATVFVPSALVGQQESEGDTAPVAKMDASQLRGLPPAVIAVGAHTRTHPDLPTLPRTEMECEVRGCRDELEALLDRPVRTFSYPFGRYDQTTVEAVKAAGYGVACTTQFGKVRLHQERYALPRVLVGDNLPLPHLAYRLWRAGAALPETGEA